MKLDTLDSLLTVWQGRIDTMLSNLAELSELTGYRLLRGKGLERLTGHRAAEIRGAVEGLDTLHQELDLLRAVVAKAKQRRHSLSMFRTAKSIADIATLLEGPSINLDAANIPLEERDFFGKAAAEVKVTPAELAKRMKATFDTVKPVLIAVDRAWSTYGVPLGKLTQEAQSMRSTFEAYGLDVPHSLVAFERHVRRAQDDLLSDPLGLESTLLEFLGSHQKAARKAAEVLVAHSEETRSRVDQASAQLEKLSQLDQACREMAAQSNARYTPVSAEALNDAMAAVEQALEALEGDALDAAAEAVSRFDGIYRPLIAPLRARHRELKAQADQAGALDERWQAAQAAASASPVGGDKVLGKFAAKIEALRAEGAPEADIERLVYAYEVRLKEMEARSRA
ncbi:MAG: hypothetical protein ACE366_20570 [Bradymonadia bacterium]